MKVRMVKSYRTHHPDLGITMDVICPVEQERMERDLADGLLEHPYRVVWLKSYGVSLIDGRFCSLSHDHDTPVPHLRSTYHN